MRRTTIATIAVGAIAVGGCGSGAKFANHPKPATPVNLTVYINTDRVSLSPASVGAGPVIFIITNQSRNAQAVTILPAGASPAQPLANAGPINPQATTEVTVNFSNPGDYTVTTGHSGSNQAAVGNPPTTQPAALHIGPPRPSASNVLLQP